MKRSPRNERETVLAAITRIAERQETALALQQLSDIGFSLAPGVADGFIAMLAKLRSDSRTRENLSRIVNDLRGSPEPAGAFLNFLRYIDTSGAPTILLNTIAGAKPLREILTVVFGASQYMSDIVIRNPGYLFWLIEKTTWESVESKEDYLAGIRSDSANFQTIEAKLNAVRRFQRRSLLKIGVKDLLGVQSIEETTRGLSRLADAIADGVLEMLFDADIARADNNTSPGFAVIALGKLGGAELNFSSDIDLIYVCDDVDDVTLERYNKLARTLTSALSEVTAEGYLYRVDLRLRPDGNVGPPVNPISAMMVYYENRGRPWEFQAMLKARVIAGNIRLGERFLEGMTSLTFNPTLSFSPLETISLMRHRIRENISPQDRAFNIKLMEGGIRDIEFIIQAIQLLHGRKHPNIRSTNTITGIGAAQEKKLLKKGEGKTLIDAYRFFRLVEHRLQMMHQRQTHSVPEAIDEMDYLARRVSRGPLGEFTRETFLSALTTAINKVRALSDRFFDSQDVPDTIHWLLFPEDEAVTEAALARYGFADTHHALAVLQSLGHGTFPHLVDRKTRESFQKLLPSLLEGVAQTGDPNQTLINFATVAEASSRSSMFYDALLESLPFRTLIRDITGTSPVLSKKLAANIHVTDRIRNDPVALIETKFSDSVHWRSIMTDKHGITAQSAYKQIVGARDQKMLAAWVIDVNSGDLPATLTRALATSARALVESACAAVFDDEKDVAVFALGSFGVAEPRLPSDLDLLVVARGGDLEPTTRAVHTLGRTVAQANLFKLDFRLRGEGKNAPLVQDIAYYKTYFATRMAAWEKIAFGKCAFWYGDPSLAEAFVAALTPHLIRAPDRQTMASLSDLRDKLEGLVPAGAVLETKRSRGGRYDIDYLCAVGLARRGVPFPLDSSTIDRAGWLAKDGLITQEQHDGLLAALRLYYRVDYLLELAGSSLPKTAERSREAIVYLDKTMELLGMGVDGGVEKALQRHRRAVRECYTELLTKNLRDV